MLVISAIAGTIGGGMGQQGVILLWIPEHVTVQTSDLSGGINHSSKATISLQTRREGRHINAKQHKSVERSNQPQSERLYREMLDVEQKRKYTSKVGPHDPNGNRDHSVSSSGSGPHRE